MDLQEIESERVQLFKGSHSMARPVTFDSGQVTLRDGQLRLLKGEGEAVAEAPISDVRY